VLGKIGSAITKLFQTRDELSFSNIRGGLLPVLAVFPLSVIIGNLRYYDHSIALGGFATNELTLFLLGFGWLILTMTPKRLIIPFLRMAAIISAVLQLCLIFMPMGYMQFALYMAFKFFTGLAAACAFFLFCFVLNNVERLFGMALIQIYYGFFYTTLNDFPAFHAAGNTWGGAVVMMVYLVVVFFCRTEQEMATDSNGKGSGVPLVIGLGVIHYMIMCMSNYIEWTENSISGLAFGLGIFVSLTLIIIIQLLKGRSALYIWLMFLALTLFGLGALLYDTPVAIISGSFAYGLGDSLGYIIICYMCAGAIKRSKSLRMFRLYCLIFFVEYVVVSGLFSVYFDHFDEPNKVLAFGVVLVLVCFCLLFMPLIQKRLFEADWTDGLYLRDMEEYTKPLAETEEINTKDSLNLTSREEEILTLLLGGSAPKEIAGTLKISYDTVLFHQKKLYRKLGIQSRSELFTRYLSRK